jgi:transposase
VLKVALTRDHLSAIGALTIDGRLIMHIQNTSCKGPDVVRFLQLLLRKVAGKLLVIWDGASIHHSGAVKDFLAAGGAKRIHLERLPGYAPELNPEVRVWNLLKRRELKNLCAADFEQLAAELVRVKERLRHRKTVLRQCIAHAGFPL